MQKTEEYRVVTQNCDFNGELRLQELMNILADFARRHAEELGFGFHGMKEKGLFWVLYQLQIEIMEMPRLDDTLEMVTQPWFRKGLKADRQFQVFRDGVCIVKAYSNWLLMDGVRRRPVPLQTQIEPMGEPLFDDAIMPSTDFPEVDDSAAILQTVKYNDIDLHHHCNNSRYAAWCMDEIGEDEWKDFRPVYADIEFKKESFFGDAIAIHIGMNQSDEGIARRFTGTNGEAPVFSLNLTMIPRA